MKKIFHLTSLALLFQVLQLQAQTSNPLRIAFGISNGIPTENQYGYSLGGDIKLQKGISDQLAATFSAGFNHYFETGKTETFVPSSSPPYPASAPWNLIPLKAGLKVFAGKNLYLAGEAGTALFLEGGHPCFIWSPSVGLAFANSLDVSAKYDAFKGYKGLNQVALRIAYGISTKKTSSSSHKAAPNGTWQLNAAIDPGVSLTNSRFVIGADLQLERYRSDNFAFTLSTGFTHFINKPYNIDYHTNDSYFFARINNDKNLIPFKLGVKIFPLNRVYIAGEAGVAVDINGNSSAIISATAGTKLGSRYDLGVKYENYTSFYGTNQIALRLAYRIF